MIKAKKIKMWKLIKVLLFSGYVLYAFNFMDDKARQGGIVGGIIALVVSVVFGYAIFYFLWLQNTDEKTTNSSKNDSHGQLKRVSVALKDLSFRNDKTRSNKTLTAKDFYKLGVVAYRNRDYYEAIKYYSEAIELDPGQERYFSGRASAMKDLRDELVTYRCDEFALENERKLPEDRFDYHENHSHKINRIPSNVISYQTEILADMTKAIELKPSSINYNNRGNFTGSVQDLDAAINLDPENDAIFFNRAFNKLFVDAPGALADYTTAIDLCPNNASYHNNRAVLKVYLGDHNGAKADFDRAKQLSPTLYEYNPGDEPPWDLQSLPIYLNNP